MAMRILEIDRRFGLMAFSLLTCSRFQDEVRVAALQRMEQEDQIIGREMAKIALVRDESPAVTHAASELLA